MTSVLSLDITNVGIGENTLPRGRPYPNEGIIRRMDDQCRHCNSLHDVRRCRPRVIVVCAGKAAIVCGDPVIKSAQARNPTKAGHVEASGKQLRLASKA